ncbi:nectin-1-like isoform X2 [Erpetoichthys calabaricus]|uniref:nectin-1-like isoform X2 n=1 Tax=Erpetoichthys calabaricus TaxID=27687 RepID=UPI0022343E2D|nr:nectin-1-like isoform X2 [Erpetoichthys calabaricus]
MLEAVCLLLAVLCHFRPSISQTVINGVLHSDVLLPFVFTKNGNSIDLKFIRAIWKKNNKELVRYESEKMEVAKRGELSEAGLRHGNASLILLQLRIEDEGDYESEVNYASEHYKKNLRLNVIASPKVSVKPLVVMDVVNVLECHVDNFYPSEISIEWLKASRPLPSQVKPQPKRNPDGTFSAVSRYHYIPTHADSGVTFSCRVRQECQERPLEETFYLQFRKRASVKLTSINLPQSQKLISCVAEDFYPADAKVIWKKNGHPINSTVQGKDGKFKKTIYHKLGATEMENEYTCEVSQEGFNNSLRENRFTQEVTCGCARQTIVLTVAGILFAEIVLGMLCYFIYVKKNLNCKGLIKTSSGSPEQAPCLTSGETENKNEGTLAKNNMEQNSAESFSQSSNPLPEHSGAAHDETFEKS